MAGMTLFAQPMAMATTQLASAIQGEENLSWRLEPKTEHNSLRMNWVVVTDEEGKRQLRMRWVTLKDRL
jgi:hypothetical protein